MLGAQPFRATHIGIAAFVEAPLLVDLSRQANARADSNFPRRPYGCSKPERPGGAQVDTIESFVDSHGLDKPPWAAREIQHLRSAARPLHSVEALERFERPQQYSRADARFFTAHVHHEGRSIREIHIRMAAFEEQGTISRRLATKSMGGGISWRIGFGFNDAPA